MRAVDAGTGRQESWPRVFVLVLNYDGKTHLEYCLPSLLATDYGNFEVVLLDNASVDGSVEFAKTHFPEITIMENEANLGWSAGNNVGIRYALDHDADYIVLQNNDTKVDPHWLRGAVQVCESNPRIGLVGFRVLQEYVRGEDPDGEMFDALSAAWKRLEFEPAHHITGAALFVRADVFRDLGLLDEVYFFYGGEDDLEHRAQRAGYEMVRVNVPLWHYNSGSSRADPLKFSVMALCCDIRKMLKNETLHEAWRQFKWLVRFVCSPKIEFDERIPHFRRLRPSNFVVNIAVLMYAVLWNVAHLPGTLRARRQAERRIIDVRREWENEGTPGH